MVLLGVDALRWGKHHAYRHSRFSFLVLFTGSVPAPGLAGQAGTSGMQFPLILRHRPVPASGSPRARVIGTSVALFGRWKVSRKPGAIQFRAVSRKRQEWRRTDTRSSNDHVDQAPSDVCPFTVTALQSPRSGSVQHPVRLTSGSSDSFVILAATGRRSTAAFITAQATEIKDVTPDEPRRRFLWLIKGDSSRPPISQRWAFDLLCPTGTRIGRV